MKMRKCEAIRQDRMQLLSKYQAGGWFRKQLAALAQEPLNPRKRHRSDDNNTAVLDDSQSDNRSVDGN